MSPPGRQATEEPIPAVNPVNAPTSGAIPRRWVKDAIRELHGMGYTVSGGEAWRLIKEWRDWRDADAREFIADEFRAYMQRRGDLMQIRGKRYVEWAVNT